MSRDLENDIVYVREWLKEGCNSDFYELNLEPALTHLIKKARLGIAVETMRKASYLSHEDGFNRGEWTVKLFNCNHKQYEVDVNNCCPRCLFPASTPLEALQNAKAR